MNSQYQYIAGEPWVPPGFWRCAACGVNVPNGETHVCLKNDGDTAVGYAQVYNMSDRDLLIQISNQLKEVIELLKKIKEKR